MMMMIIIIIILVIVEAAASEEQSSSRQVLNWDVVLGGGGGNLPALWYLWSPSMFRVTFLSQAERHYHNSQLWWTSVWPSSSQGQISAALLITDPHSLVSGEVSVSLARPKVRTCTHTLS